MKFSTIVSVVFVSQIAAITAFFFISSVSCAVHSVSKANHRNTVAVRYTKYI